MTHYFSSLGESLQRAIESGAKFEFKIINGNNFVFNIIASRKIVSNVENTK